MNDRPLPPPLEFPIPPCSICGEECQLDENFYCPMCGATWPTEGAPEGEWNDEPKADQCPSEHRPWAAEKYANIPILRAKVYRCVLDAGHADAGRGADRHLHPEWQDGWTDAEAVRDA
jgi:hypothetical protein